MNHCSQCSELMKSLNSARLELVHGTAERKDEVLCPRWVCSLFPLGLTPVSQNHSKPRCLSSVFFLWSVSFSVDEGNGYCVATWKHYFNYKVVNQLNSHPSILKCFSSLSLFLSFAFSFYFLLLMPCFARVSLLSCLFVCPCFVLCLFFSTFFFLAP